MRLKLGITYTEFQHKGCTFKHTGNRITNAQFLTGTYDDWLAATERLRIYSEVAHTIYIYLIPRAHWKDNTLKSRMEVKLPTHL